MGKRSRKRTAPGAPRPAAPKPVAGASSGPRPGAPVSRKAKPQEAPQALWHPVPLTESLIFIGLVLVVVGFFTETAAALFVGIALVSVAALELAIREHFAGYKSHSSLLAALVGVLVALPLYWTSLPPEALLLVAALVGAGAFQVLRNAFARQAGGLKFRA